MTKEQALEEKQMIQKALLSFEKTFGRPVSRQTAKSLAHGCEIIIGTGHFSASSKQNQTKRS